VITGFVDAPHLACYAPCLFAGLPNEMSLSTRVSSSAFVSISRRCWRSGARMLLLDMCCDEIIACMRDFLPVAVKMRELAG
jgi:hypothetical protein